MPNAWFYLQAPKILCNQNSARYEWLKIKTNILERSKICGEVRISFAKDVGYKKQPEQLFQLVRAIHSP